MKKAPGRSWVGNGTSTNLSVTRDEIFSMAFPDNQLPFLKAESEQCSLKEEDTLPLTHFEDHPAYLLDCCGSLPYAEGFTC